jgi:hypothetical protein
MMVMALAPRLLFTVRPPHPFGAHGKRELGEAI